MKKPTITRFYKILYKGKDVVYVGITLREINKRFREHLLSKSLNTTDYSIIEFDRLEHPEINSIDIYYEERNKVVELERKYIQEEKDKGSILLNIGIGGEGWGTNIIEKLRKEEFIKEYGSWEGYKEYRKKRIICNIWLGSWTYTKTENKCKKWLVNWVSHRLKDKCKQWLVNWVSYKTINKCKHWLSHWTCCRINNI